MERYKLILAYDGTQFQGFQRQGKTRTVQLVLETALRKLGWEGRSILSAGRTDTGVHASGQVVAFDLDWKHTTEDMANALNNWLADDLAVKAVTVVDDAFHPRFDAVERSYRYHMYTTLHRDPLRERYSWRIPPGISLELLKAASACLPGEHDFAAFGVPHRPGGSTVRYIYSADWLATGDDLYYEVHGNAFLYHMVRRLVFTLVQVGLNRLSLEAFAASVREPRPLPPGLAPAQGLMLLEVRYAANRQEAVRYIKTLL
jgi:tRNA pseudouridine38-40 synthase